MTTQPELETKASAEATAPPDARRRLDTSPQQSPDSPEAAIVRLVVGHLRPGLPVVLWTGETIGADRQADQPNSPQPRRLTDLDVDSPYDPEAEPIGPRVRLRSPDVVSRLLRAPSLGTVIELWAEGTLDIENGSVLDAAVAYERARAADPRGFKHRLRTLPRGRIARMLPSLLPGAWRAKARIALPGQRRFRAGGGRKEIGHHYDVSNAFYRLFLDERMVYTCAYFERDDMTLDEAQEAKLDLVCRKLRLREGERLLDIGCGWGALLIHAAERYGARGHGVTLSEEQAALARERIAERGLSDRITIELKPFEGLEGSSFDKIASIGMFEHVGLRHHDAYFRNVHRLLKPSGLYLHHAITRRMKTSKRAFGTKSAEHKALVRYIFPGGELDTLGLSVNGLEAHRFEVHDCENLRPHYGRTCRMWAERLHARMEEAVGEIGEPRARLWLLYLSGCALAFERGSVQINQTLASKRKKGLVPVPWTRDDLYWSRPPRSSSHRNNPQTT